MMGHGMEWYCQRAATAYNLVQEMTSQEVDQGWLTNGCVGDWANHHGKEAKPTPEFFDESP